MALDTDIVGGVSGNKAEVDANNNIYIRVPGYDGGGVSRGGGSINGPAIFSENDAGSVTGVRRVSSPITTQNRRLKVGLDTPLFCDNFNATTQNTSLWSYTFATLTASQPGAGTVNFGTVQGTTSAHGAFMRTFQYFPQVGTAPLVAEISFGQFNAAMIANEEWYAGFGLPGAANTAPTDGVWVKLTTSGLVLEAKYNGSLVSSAALATLASFTVGTQYKIKLVFGQDVVDCWREGVYLGSLNSAVTDAQPVIMASLPFFMQKLNTGSVSNTNTMRVGTVNIFLQDMNTSKPWEQTLGSLGQSGYIGQNGHTQGKTTLWTNSTAPTAVALTNTAAAFTGLGGIVAVLPTLTASNDGKLITYQNPVPSINISGRNLIITGVRIQGVVTVILAGGPVMYAFAIAFGHTATSLATAETASFATATTHAPRILPLGIDTYAATAAVGTLGTFVNVQFTTPVVVRPGEFVDIVARNVGTVTTTGAITYIIGYDCYFE